MLSAFNICFIYNASNSFLLRKKDLMKMYILLYIVFHLKILFYYKILKKIYYY